MLIFCVAIPLSSGSASMIPAPSVTTGENDIFCEYIMHTVLAVSEYHIVGFYVIKQLGSQGSVLEISSKIC